MANKECGTAHLQDGREELHEACVPLHGRTWVWLLPVAVQFGRVLAFRVGLEVQHEGEEVMVHLQCSGLLRHLSHTQVFCEAAQAEKSSVVGPELLRLLCQVRVCVDSNQRPKSEVVCAVLNEESIQVSHRPFATYR